MNTNSYNLKESYEDTSISYLQKKMDDYNSKLIPPENSRKICYFLEDSEGKIIGGIMGETLWRSFHIHTIWIEKEIRGKGLGRKLIQAAEEKAKSYDCIYSMVGTFEALGARPFYERLGYKIESKSVDSPQGHIGYFFYKKI